MKISGSILAVSDNYMEYARQLKYVNVDYLHIDIFEDSGRFRMSELFDFDDSYLPLDVHLIYKNINDEMIDIINKSRVSYLNIQYEKLLDKSIIPYLADSIKANFGLAYTISTPIDVIENNLQYCSQVLFMCSEPGVSGAVFNNENYKRIEKFHNEHPQILIFVDGGIDGARAKRMERLGVFMAVSGSFLCRDRSHIGINAFALRYFDEQDILVDNKVIPIASLPVVGENELFLPLINVMNKYRFGIVFVIEDEILKGIIADGDIRRGFAKYGKEIFDKNARTLMNHKPYCALMGTTIKDVYDDISMLHKGIEVIPIIENDRMLGALDLRFGK